MPTSSTNAKLVLIGDSVIANFDKCSNIFDKFFLPFHTPNFGIRDKIQNVLWHVYNMTLPASVEYVIIHFCSNNIGHNSPLKIAEGLINIALILKKNYKNFHIFVSCPLPRDDEKSVKRFYYTGFDLMTRDSYFMIQVEVFMNHILAENKYFTNHREITRIWS